VQISKSRKIARNGALVDANNDAKFHKLLNRIGLSIGDAAAGSASSALLTALFIDNDVPFPQGFPQTPAVRRTYNPRKSSFHRPENESSRS
jgi:hypothetical protein